MEDLPYIARGSHGDISEGACIMEFVSFINKDEEFSDYPACVSNWVAELTQLINDTLSDSGRQKLWRYFDRFFDTVMEGDEFFRLFHLERESLGMSSLERVSQINSDYLEKVERISNKYKGDAITANHDRGLQEAREEKDDELLRVLEVVLDLVDEVLGREKVVKQDLSVLKDVAGNVR